MSWPPGAAGILAVMAWSTGRLYCFWKPGAGNRPANLTDEASMTALLDINLLLDELETGLRRVLEQRGVDSPALIGIRTGGVWLADEIGRASWRERVGVVGGAGCVK